MKKKIQIIPSGISLVDKFWGGFYRGGTYFLIGEHKSGKTLLGIQYAIECVKQKEVCLYFTTMRPKDLMIHAASIDFDLQKCMDENLIIVVRVTPSSNTQRDKIDEYLLEYLTDIASLVKQYYPNRIVFDELTPFIEFQNLGLLKNIFLQTIETIEEANINSLFILSEPATPQSKNIVDILTSQSTGTIYLEKAESEFRIKKGTMTIIPNIGHIEGTYSAGYYLEPYKGITTEQKLFNEKIKNIKHPDKSGYQSLSEIETPESDFAVYNFYSLDEFSLLIENQIAVYRKSKRKCYIISFRLNPEAETSGMLSLNQLKNAIRLSIDRKDKICAVNDKVLVLFVNEEEENLKIYTKVKSNLPQNKPEELSKILEYISIYSLVIDETVETADDILNILLNNEKGENENGHFI